jgi:hypothetical protein
MRCSLLKNYTFLIVVSLSLPHGWALHFYRALLSWEKREAKIQRMSMAPCVYHLVNQIREFEVMKTPLFRLEMAARWLKRGENRGFAVTI